MRESSPGKVFIAEDLDDWPGMDGGSLAERGVDFRTLEPGDVLCFTGRFDAHWEPDDDDRSEFREGPTGVSVADAIAWGRSQADVVYVRVGDGDLGGADGGYFSAGVLHPDPEMPVWPDGGLEVVARPVRGQWRRVWATGYEFGGGS